MWRYYQARDNGVVTYAVNHETRQLAVCPRYTEQDSPLHGDRLYVIPIEIQPPDDWAFIETPTRFIREFN